MSELERFFAKVGGPDDNGCWPWLAAKKWGYGCFALDGGRIQVRAHRYSYEVLVGPIPDGLTIDHLCRNRGCVNPSHLEPVTMGINVLRGEGPSAKNARATHCSRGHPYDEKNTYRRKDGGRDCRRCMEHHALKRKTRRQSFKQR
jgi:hypothetical protein